MQTEDQQFTRPQHGNGLSHESGPSPGHGIAHILVCLDGSAGSAICIAYALSLANTFGSEVTLVHVMQHQHDRFGPHTTDALDWEVARQEAGARLEALEKQAAQTSGLRIGVRLEQGHPAERIIALSRELGVDLVVLGSDEASGRTTWELGNTAQQVLAAARTSVLIARGDFSLPAFASPKRILVPLDGSLRTESVLPTAESIATAHHATLVLVHVVEEPLATGILAAPDDLQVARDLATRLEARATCYLERLQHQVGYDESRIRTLVTRQADKRQFLVELLARERVDLIVLSAHGSTCNAAIPFGSVTAHLLTHSRVPLLVLQDLPKPELQSHDSSDEQSAPASRGAFASENA